MQKLKPYLSKKKQLTEKLLRKHLPLNTVVPKTIHTAMRYSVLNGGKRIRPILCFLANEILGGKEENAYQVAVALELVHCYSLVHDDLPALDNDDLRRGRATTHKKYGEAMAILTGDALLTRAFEVLSVIKDSQILKKVLPVFSYAISSKGMIGGQVKDLEVEGKKFKRNDSIKFLKYIHTNKTAKLIQVSLLAGALTANSTKKQYSALSDYGLYLGLLFQISDDILDILGDKKKIGKSGTDARNKKLTYPSIYGIEQSIKIENEIAKKAKKAIQVFNQEHREILEHLVDYIIKREK